MARWWVVVVLELTLIVLTFAGTRADETGAAPGATTSAATGAADQLDQLLVALPEPLAEAMRHDPVATMEDAAGLIFAFGGGLGIDRSGIETAIALQRAEIRAREMRKLLLADLDNDGVITAAEVKAVGPAVGARAQGRMVVAMEAADTDHDARVTPTELRAQAQRAALRKLSESAADDRRLFLLFDLDTDGFVTLAEFKRGLDALMLGAPGGAITGSAGAVGGRERLPAAL